MLDVHFKFMGEQKSLHVVKTFIPMSFNVHRLEGTDTCLHLSLFRACKIETLKIVCIWLTLSLRYNNRILWKRMNISMIWMMAYIHIKLFLGEKFGKYKLPSSILFVNICVWYVDFWKTWFSNTNTWGPFAKF